MCIYIVEVPETYCIDFEKLLEITDKKLNASKGSDLGRK
jgi:hypothetical protein